MAEISKNPNWSIMVRFQRFLWLISSVVSHTKILAGQSSETVGYNPSAGKHAFSLHFRSKNGTTRWTWGTTPTLHELLEGDVDQVADMIPMDLYYHANDYVCAWDHVMSCFFFFSEFLAQILVQNGSRMARVMNSPSAWPRCGVIPNVDSKDAYGPIQQI